MLIIANWKMNGNKQQVRSFCRELRNFYPAINNLKIVLCVPFPYLLLAGDMLADCGVFIGGQDCSPHDSGAFTGDVAAKMLYDVGAKFVILGHSERRTTYGEGCSLIKQKIITAHNNDLTPIVCVGDGEGDSQSKVTKQVKRILSDNIYIAYEPLWAIGTGKTASAEIIATTHKKLHNISNKMPILYGGSVNAGNVGAILSIPNVSGVLVGGASCNWETFMPLLQVACDTVQKSS